MGERRLGVPLEIDGDFGLVPLFLEVVQDQPQELYTIVPVHRQFVAGLVIGGLLPSSSHLAEPRDTLDVPEVVGIATCDRDPNRTGMVPDTTLAIEQASDVGLDPFSESPTSSCLAWLPRQACNGT